MPKQTIEMDFYKSTKKDFRFLSTDLEAPVRQVQVAKEFFGVERTASACPVGAITVTIEALPALAPGLKDPLSSPNHGPGAAPEPED